jgi:hypothetical protein
MISNLPEPYGPQSHLDAREGAPQQQANEGVLPWSISSP